MLDPHGFVATCNSVNFFIVRTGEVRPLLLAAVAAAGVHAVQPASNACMCTEPRLFYDPWHPLSWNCCSSSVLANAVHAPINHYLRGVLLRSAVLASLSSWIAARQSS